MFAKKSVPIKAPPEEPPPARRFADNVREFDTVVGRNMHLKGNLEGKANVDVRGALEGETRLQGLLIVQVEGKHKGNISATNVIVEGQVEGNISSTNKVELRASCRVTGDIGASSVAIAEGCFYEGTINMGDAPVTRSFQEKRSSLRGHAPASAVGDR